MLPTLNLHSRNNSLISRTMQDVQTDYQAGTLDCILDIQSQSIAFNKDQVPDKFT